MGFTIICFDQRTKCFKVRFVVGVFSPGGNVLLFQYNTHLFDMLDLTRSCSVNEFLLGFVP